MLDMTKGAQAVRRMTENRAALLKDYPFFGSLMMRMPFGLARCGTACTDGERLIMDPEFATRLSDEESRFVMLHELLYCALHHCVRGRGLQADVYNIACDIVVNAVILQMYGLKSFRVDGEEVMHTAPDRKEGYRYSAEQIYEMLLKKYGNSAEALFCGHGIDRHDLWKEIQNPGRLQALWDEYLQESGKWSMDSGTAPRWIGAKCFTILFSTTSMTSPSVRLTADFRTVNFSLRPFIQTRIPARRLSSGCALTRPPLFLAASPPWRSGR